MKTQKTYTIEYKYEGKIQTRTYNAYNKDEVKIFLKIDLGYNDHKVIKIDEK